MKNLNQSIRDLIFSSKCTLCREEHGDTEPYLCYNCYEKIRKKINIRKKESVYYATYYDFEIKKLIASFKLKRRRYLAILIGKLIKEELLKLIASEEVDVIIPVPINSIRKRSRGYNQVEEILDYVGVEYQTLKRIKNTLPMHSLSNEKLRRENISKSFESNLSLEGKTILIVDDIVTTGSTVKELVSSIKENGSPEKVIVFTFALAKTALVSDLSF